MVYDLTQARPIQCCHSQANLISSDCPFNVAEKKAHFMNLFFCLFSRPGKAGDSLCPGQEGGHQDRQQGEAQRERSAKGTAVISKPKLCYKQTVERNARIQSTYI